MMLNQDPHQEPVMDQPAAAVPMEAESGASYGGRGIDLDEAKAVLASMSLTSVPFGRYLLVMRTECDVVIGEEPYVALALWLNLETGKFMARIWNQGPIV